MAVINKLFFPEYIRYPNWGCNETGGWTRVPIRVNKSGEYLCAVFAAPKTGNIRKIHFFTDICAKSGKLDIRVEDIEDSSGNGSGILWGTGTQTTVMWNHNYELISAQLESDASVHQGDEIAVRIAAGKDAPPNGGIAYYDQEIYSGFPYHVADIVTPIKNPYSASLWIEYADGSMPNIPWQRRLFGSGNIFKVDTVKGSRYGIQFQLPCNGKISGAWLQVGLGDGLSTLELWVSGETAPVRTVLIDGKEVQSVGGVQPTYHLFSEDFDVEAFVQYLLILKTGESHGAYHHKFGQPSLGQRLGGWDFITEAIEVNPPLVCYTSAAPSVDSPPSWLNEPTSIVPMAALLNEISVDGGSDPDPNPTYFIVVKGDLAVFDNWEDLKDYMGEV